MNRSGRAKSIGGPVSISGKSSWHGICCRVHSCSPLVVLALLLIILAPCFQACGYDLLGKAREAEARGEYAVAVQLYRACLEKEPDNLEALRGVTAILFLQRRFDDALPYQERLVALDSKDIQTRIELGFNYLNHQGRLADAARVFGEAAALDPSARNLTFWAQALIAADNAGQAEKVLRRAIETDPKYQHSYVVLLGLLRAENRDAEAEELLRQAENMGLDTTGWPGT